jgi:GMC oxidoreductase
MEALPQVKNLFIVDGSIWVTSGVVNPTSTIQALALFIAESVMSAWQRCSTDLALGCFALEWSLFADTDRPRRELRYFPLGGLLRE